MSKTATSNPTPISTFSLSQLKDIPFAEKEEVLKTHVDVTLTVQEIIDKIESKGGSSISKIIALLGKDTKICRLFYLEGKVNIALPKIYKDESGKVGLYDACEHPNVIENLTDYAQYQTTIARPESGNTEDYRVAGVQYIKVKDNDYQCAIAAPIALSEEYVKSLIKKDQNGESVEEDLKKGKGIVPADILKYYPRPYKLSSEFEVGQSYKILADFGLDPRPNSYNRHRYLIQKIENDTPVGNPFETLANYSLKKHWEQFGDRPCTVVNKIEKDRGYVLKFALSELANAS